MRYDINPYSHAAKGGISHPEGISHRIGGISQIPIGIYIAAVFPLWITPQTPRFLCLLKKSILKKAAIHLRNATGKNDAVVGIVDDERSAGQADVYVGVLLAIAVLYGGHNGGASAGTAS